MSKYILWALYLSASFGVGYSVGYGRELSDLHLWAGLLCFGTVLLTLPLLIFRRLG